MNFVTNEKIETKIIEKVSANFRGVFFEYIITFNKISGRYGVSDIDGEILIKPFYQEIEYLGQSFFLLKLGDNYGIRDADDDKNFPVPVNFSVIEKNHSKQTISFYNPTTGEKMFFNLRAGTTSFRLE